MKPAVTEKNMWLWSLPIILQVDTVDWEYFYHVWSISLLEVHTNLTFLKLKMTLNLIYCLNFQASFTKLYLTFMR